MEQFEILGEFAAQVAREEGFMIGNPCVCGENSFVPIINSIVQTESNRKYYTLEEAILDGWCKVTELGTAVNLVKLKNGGQWPILVEEGDLFAGKGTQDRMSVATLLIYPGQSIEVGVKCVQASKSLQAGVAFDYGGRASRRMLLELRRLKSNQVMACSPAANLDQNAIWHQVTTENAQELPGVHTDQYSKTIQARRTRVESRARALNMDFPPFSTGLAVVDADGEIRALEFHGDTLSFRARQNSILLSMEGSINWDQRGEKARADSPQRVRSLFDSLTKVVNEGKIHERVGVPSLGFELNGLPGECLIARFYDNICPHCKQTKPRRPKCPHCRRLEERPREVAYMSLA